MTLFRYYEDERFRSLTGSSSARVIESVSRRDRLRRYSLFDRDGEGALQYYYLTRSNNDNNWLIKRIAIDDNIPVIAYANINNNDTIVDINAAILARDTLTFASDVDID